jgi:EAL domain-containing protein (putative c-di-GMP-specific phosphodiesterase class I)
MAERRGLLLPIDQMVERSPLLVANGWPSDISVSINCPAFEFLDPGMAVQLKEHLDRAGLNPERCYIEVTESALLQDDEQVLSVMRQVKALGVNLAIDDFGSGHASLSYLHRFPFNLIKIDRSFIQAMDKDAGAAAIVEATLALSRRLGLEVVAEGVETTEQFLHLQQLGCTYVQGFLIARPMNEEHVLPFLESFRLSDVLECPAHA